MSHHTIQEGLSVWVKKRNTSPIRAVVIGWLCLLQVSPLVVAQKKSSPVTIQSSTPAGRSENQGQDDDSNPPPSSAELAAAPSGGKLILSEYEFWLSAEVLAFGFAVLVAEFLLLRRAKITAEEALRVYAVSLILIGTLFAITAGFDSNQIAPAMGLFGTIAGYLLGKRVPAKASAPEEEEK
jgi:hypothetical protein